MVNRGGKNLDVQCRRQKAADLVAVLNHRNAHGESRECSKNTHDHSLCNEDSDNLVRLRPQRLHDSDLAGLLHGHCDERVHDSEGGDQNDEHEKKKHDISFHADRVEDLFVHVDPAHREVWSRQGGVQFVAHRVGEVGVGGGKGQAVGTAPEVVEFLADVERHEKELAVVEIASALEDPSDLEFGWQDHLLQSGDICRFVARALDAVEFVKDLVEIPRRENRHILADAHSEFAGEFRADHGLVAIQVIAAIDDEIRDIHDLALEFGIDAPDFWSEAAVLIFHNDRALNEWRGGFDMRIFHRLLRCGLPVFQNPAVADDNMGIEADDLAAEFLLEAGHHRNDQNQNHDPERDSEDRNQGDDRKKGALGLEVAQGEKKAETFRHGSCGIFTRGLCRAHSLFSPG